MQDTLMSIQIIQKHRTTTMLFHMLMRQLKLLMIQVCILEWTVRNNSSRWK